MGQYACIAVGCMRTSQNYRRTRSTPCSLVCSLRSHSSLSLLRSECSALQSGAASGGGAGGAGGAGGGAGPLFPNTHTRYSRLRRCRLLPAVAIAGGGGGGGADPADNIIGHVRIK